MTESFAREHFAHRIKIGWLGLDLSKEQTLIPHTNTLWFSLEVLVSSGGRRYFFHATYFRSHSAHQLDCGGFVQH